MPENCGGQSRVVTVNGFPFDLECPRVKLISHVETRWSQRLLNNLGSSE